MMKKGREVMTGKHPETTWKDTKEEQRKGGKKMSRGPQGLMPGYGDGEGHGLTLGVLF